FLWLFFLGRRHVLHVPDADRTVHRRGDDVGVTGEHDCRYGLFVALQLRVLLLLLHVPNFHDVIFAGPGGGEQLAIRTERDGVNRPVVRAEVLQFLTVGGVPQLHGFIRAGGGDEFAIGAEGDGVDDVGVALQFEFHLAVAEVPHAGGFVLAGG